jgi:hypothetical protein
MRGSLILFAMVCGTASAACSRTSAESPKSATPDAASSIDPGPALSGVRDCLEGIGLAENQWSDAFEVANGTESQCRSVLMKMRHMKGLVENCRSLLGSPKLAGSAGPDRERIEKELGAWALGVDAKLKPESTIGETCKKWRPALMDLPVEGPPRTSIPDGLCPTYGQVIRDARNHYNGMCAYLGSCRHALTVADRAADPYDKTRCDTSVKMGRTPVFISALYRRVGDSWQLEAIR